MTNYSDIITLTQIMAVNGDVPVNVAGWMKSTGYAGATQRSNGVVGEGFFSGITAYVCVSGNVGLVLPNSHPDYRPTETAVWVSVPVSVDQRYIKEQYKGKSANECRIN